MSLDTGQRKDGVGVGVVVVESMEGGDFYNGKFTYLKTQSIKNSLLYRKERGSWWWWGVVEETAWK